MNPVPSWTHKDLVLVVILTVIALVLRIIALNEGMWFDEIATLINYVRLPVLEIIGRYDTLNNHILYTLFAHLSTGWFGESAWSVRLPAVVFGVATIPATYYLGRQLASRNEAFLASALLAFSHHHVWFSQNARGYTGLLLGAVILSILFIRLLSMEKPGYRLVLAYAIVAALATWIHLTAALVVIAHGFTWLVVISGQAWKGRIDLKPAAAQSLMLAGLFSLALYAGVLFQRWHRFDTAVVATQNQFVWTSTGWVLAEFVSAMNKAIPGDWPVILLGILTITTGIWVCLKRGAVTAGILILPVLVTLAFVSWFMNVIFPRFLFSSMVFFLLIAVIGGFTLCRLVLPMISTRAVTAIGLIIALATATMVPGAWKPKQDFIAAAEFVNEHRVPGDAVVCPGLTYTPLRVYLGLDCLRVRTETELIELEQTHSRTWFLYTFPIPLRNRMPDVWNKIHNDYHRVTRIKGTVGDGDIVIMLNSLEIEAEWNK